MLSKLWDSTTLYFFIKQQLDSKYFTNPQLNQLFKEKHPEYFKANTLFITKLEGTHHCNDIKVAVDKVLKSPRGTCVIFQNNRNQWQFMINDGEGHIDGKYDTYLQYPTESQILSSFLDMEVYILRAEYSASALRERSQAVIDGGHLFIGAQLKNIRLTGSTTVYSTALVNAINRHDLTVTLQLTKRGSAKRWESTVHAYMLDNYLPVKNHNHLTSQINTPPLELALT